MTDLSFSTSKFEGPTHNGRFHGEDGVCKYRICIIRGAWSGWFCTSLTLLHRIADTFADGTVYKGGFKNGMFHGRVSWSNFASTSLSSFTALPSLPPGLYHAHVHPMSLTRVFAWPHRAR